MESQTQSVTHSNEIFTRRTPLSSNTFTIALGSKEDMWGNVCYDVHRYSPPGRAMNVLGAHMAQQLRQLLR